MARTRRGANRPGRGKRARVPADIEALSNRLAEEKKYLEDEIRTEHGFADIIGTNSGLKEVLRQVEIVAPADATALILGETGTGKELVARAIHRLSKRVGRTLREAQLCRNSHRVVRK